MTNEISCDMPEWVAVIWYWKEDRLITNQVFNTVMSYLVNADIGICEILEHIF